MSFQVLPGFQFPSVYVLRLQVMPLGPAPVEGLMPASLGQEHMTLGDDLSTCHLIDFIDSFLDIRTITSSRYCQG